MVNSSSASEIAVQVAGEFDATRRLSQIFRTGRPRSVSRDDVTLILRQRIVTSSLDEYREDPFVLSQSFTGGLEQSRLKIFLIRYSKWTNQVSFEVSVQLFMIV